jgi:hypothetical protein
MRRPELSELNEKIAAKRAAVTRRDRLARLLEAAARDRSRLEAEVAELAEKAARGRRDVERLAGAGLTALYYTLMGTGEERLDRRHQEAVAATLKHDQAQSELAALRTREEQLTASVEELADEAELVELLREKEERPELFAVSEEIGRLQALAGEIDEALEHGGRARSALTQVMALLDEARSWSAIDLVGGAGLRATQMRHAKIDAARQQLVTVQTALGDFRRELQDVALRTEAEFEIGALSSFAGTFFDSLVSVWSVQARINNACGCVRETMRQLDAALLHLDARREQADGQIESKARQRAEMIESWS